MTDLGAKTLLLYFVPLARVACRSYLLWHVRILHASSPSLAFFQSAPLTYHLLFLSGLYLCFAFTMNALVARYSRPGCWQDSYAEEEQDNLYNSTPSLSLKFALPPIANVSAAQYFCFSGHEQQQQLSRQMLVT